MREEIRLGNEALARNDVDTAVHCFKQVLETGGTVIQERIAANRLREIEARRLQVEAQRNPAPAKPRARRKSTSTTKSDPEPDHRFVRPPEEPIVVIKRY